MRICICFKPVEFQAEYTKALLSNIPEELLKVSAPLKRAFEDIRDWVCNEGGGTVYNDWGECIIAAIPADKADNLTNFVGKFAYTSKLVMAVGLGSNPLESYYAMEVAEKELGQRIVVYSADMEANISSECPEEMTKSEDQYNLDFPNLKLEESESSPEPDKHSELKNEVLQTLQNLKQQSGEIGKLKEVAPDAYQAVKSLIDSFIKIAQATKE